MNSGLRWDVVQLGGGVWRSMAQIFISHSSEDGEQARRLQEWLHAQGFVSTFLDFDASRGIAAGADWERTLYRELNGADAVLLILTKNWFGSKWCFVEFAQARALGKAIFPLIETPTGETFVSRDIQHLNLVRDRAGGLQRLHMELTRIALNTRGGYGWDARRAPYPGLLAFDEADAAIYFGRDDEVRRLLERLNARRAQGGEKLVVVLGASGSGKSSLLRAGVVPRLKRDPHQWIALPVFRPGHEPLDELAQCLATGVGAPAQWRTWREKLNGSELAGTLAELGRDLRAAAGHNEAQVLLVIDQGEELFGAGNGAQTTQFWTVLNAMLDERLPFLVTMTLRSDYLGKLQEEARLQRGFEQFSLKTMPLDRVREVIEGPARVAGVHVEDALVAAAMADARTEDALPLLAFALRELYDRCAGSGQLTAEAYRAMGDAGHGLSPLENAVRRKADEVLAAAKPEADDLQALREAFVPALVRINTAGEYVRRAAPLAGMPERASALLERLARARLLTIVDRDGSSTVEVAHEALLRKWPLLRGWIDEEREFLLGKDQLEADLLDWQGAAPAQKDDALLTGLKLSRARHWMETRPQHLTAAERAFIAGSVARQEAQAAAVERGRRRVLQGAVAAALVMAMIAIGALVLWREADSRRLAAQSIEDSRTDFGLALKEAVEAGRTGSTREAEQALHVAVEATPGQEYVLHHGGGVVSSRFSPDGQRVVTASMDGTARVWSATDGRLVATLTGHGGLVNGAVFSADSQRVLTAGVDATARVWSAEDGRQLLMLKGHSGMVNAAVFRPDGGAILTAGEDGAALVWDAAGGQMLRKLEHPEGVRRAVFSPDGRLVLTTCKDGVARIWSEQQAKDQPVELRTAGKRVSLAVFTPDGSSILTGNDDGTAALWDLAGKKTGVTFAAGGPADYQGAVADVAFSPDGSKVALANGALVLYDVRDGSVLFPLNESTMQTMEVRFSRDGTQLLSGSYAGAATLWDVRRGRPLLQLPSRTAAVTSVDFGTDRNTVVTANFDGTAELWHLENGHVARSFRAPEGASMVGADGALRDGALWYVTARENGPARVYADGTLHAELRGDQQNITEAVFSRDGTRILTADKDGKARLWKSSDGTLMATMQGQDGPVNAIALSPDGKLLATGGEENGIRIWNAETGQLVRTLEGIPGGVDAVAFSPEDGGKRVATGGSNGCVMVFDVATGKVLSRSFSGTATDLDDVSFSPDGKTVLAAGSMHTARIWRSADGKLVSSLPVRSERITAAGFRPDGARMATASDDGTVEVWDATSGHRFTTLRTIGPVIKARYSADGKDLILLLLDGSIQVYRMDQDELSGWAAKHLPVDRGK